MRQPSRERNCETRHLVQGHRAKLKNQLADNASVARDQTTEMSVGVSREGWFSLSRYASRVIMRLIYKFQLSNKLELKIPYNNLVSTNPKQWNVQKLPPY